MISLPDKQIRFMSYLRSKLGRPVLWDMKGEAKYDNVIISDVFDCSGLVTCALYNAGCGDMRQTHNAQKLANETQATENPVEGDLVFYGQGTNRVIHVGVWLPGGQCLTGSGASKQVATILDAIRARHCVEIRPVLKYRLDFLNIHSNKWISTKEVNV